MGIGLAYTRWLRRRNEDWFLFGGVFAVALAWLSTIVVGFTGGPAQLVSFTAEVGRVVAVFYPLAYPLWYWIGGELIFLLIGRGPAQGGALWLYRIEDTTSEFDPPWNQ